MILKTTDRTNDTLIAIREASGLRRWAESFILAKRAEQKSPGTLRFYSEKLKNFLDWCDRRRLGGPEELTAQTVREFLLYLEQAGHNPGGVHGHFRAVKSFVRWWAAEDEPAGWRDPFAKVKAPKVPDDLLDPVDETTVKALLAACRTHQGLRNKAIILMLFDTGLRAGEVVQLDVADVDPLTGSVAVRRGKGQKGRVVFLGQRTRRALRAYLKERGPAPGPLFVSQLQTRFTYKGLREVVRLTSERAGVKFPPLHSFRRAFALNCLRNGMDAVTLSRLLGHAGLNIIQRYLKQTDDDLRTAHAVHSPADRANL